MNAEIKLYFTSGLYSVLHSFLVCDQAPKKREILLGPYRSNVRSNDSKLSSSNSRFGLSYHISFSCLVAHRAFTELLHSSLLVAAVRTSSHDLQPASCLSFSTVRLQMVFGLPLLLLPSGAQLMATLQSSLRSFLRIHTPSCRFQP